MSVQAFDMYQWHLHKDSERHSNKQAQKYQGCVPSLGPLPSSNSQCEVLQNHRFQKIEKTFASDNGTRVSSVATGHDWLTQLTEWMLVLFSACHAATWLVCKGYYRIQAGEMNLQIPHLNFFFFNDSPTHSVDIRQQILQTPSTLLGSFRLRVLRFISQMSELLHIEAWASLQHR